MSLELKKECIQTGAILKEASYDQKLDMELALPDYCADIKKILRCTVTPGVHTVSLSGERATAKGTGTVRIIYLAEGDKIDVYEKSFDLSSSVQLKDVASEVTVTARSAADFVNCRALSQRKVNVNSAVSTIFTCYGTQKEEYALSDDKSIVQIKAERVGCENSLGFFEKTFDMAETVALNSEHPAVSKIISCSCRVLNQSHKLSQGKLLVKGDAVTDICYLAEGDKNELHSFSHSMPISQIIDVRQVPDTALCRLKLRVCQQLCSFKADSSGSNRLVDIALRVSAFIEAYEKKECDLITDCYCTAYEIKESFDKPGLLLPVREINEARQARCELELSSPIKEIKLVGCKEITKNIKCDKNELKSACSAVVFIIYTDENGIPCCQEKNVDFDFSYQIVKSCNEPFATLEVEPLTASASKMTGERAELILDYNVSANIYSNYGGKILRSLTVFDEKPKQNNGAALTVYFALKGENLWTIAREHGSTAELIMKENSLENQLLEENTMLMIPCV